MTAVELQVDPVQEQYLQWKANTPKLYTHLHTQNTIWPSLQVRFLPDLEHSITPGVNSFRLLTTLHSSGQRDNDFIRINKYTTTSTSDVKENVRMDKFDQELEEFRSVNNKSSNEFSILQNLRVPITEGDINCIEYVPQNPDLISFGCGNGGICLTDKTKHASNLEMTDDNSTLFYDIEFSPYEDSEVTGLSWNFQTMGKLLTSSTAGSVKLFDINKFQKTDEKLNELQIVQSDDSGTNAIVWIPTHDSIFFTANESNTFKIFDTRSGNPPLVSSNQFHEDGINCLSINPFNTFLLSTGDTRGNINIWDIRQLDSPTKILSNIHKDSVTCLEFNPNKPTILASGSEDTTVQLYDFSKDKEDILSFRHGGHILGVNDIAWNLHYEGMIASVANDNTLQVWKCIDI